LFVSVYFLGSLGSMKCLCTSSRYTELTAVNFQTASTAIDELCQWRIVSGVS